jgi:S-adenosylmethionine:tRNA-ribosyltransferase-isomerase (queuine synthetase)
MFVIFDFKTEIYAEYINRLTTYLPTKFHLPRCSCTLIILIEPIAKESIRLSTILLFAFH